MDLYRQTIHCLVWRERAEGEERERERAEGEERERERGRRGKRERELSLIHISEPTRLA